MGKTFYRVFLASMVLLAVLGIVLLLGGARQHEQRPRTPVYPSGNACGQPLFGEAAHV